MMRTIRRLTLFLVFGLAASVAPVHAQGSGSHGKSPISWQQRDTAVYVVSTLNLLGRRGNHTVQQAFQRLNITRIDVYADSAQNNLYFIELKRDDGTLAGSLAYQIGWLKPKRIAWPAGRTIPVVAGTIARAYRADSKTLIGSFTSTLSLQTS
jgi:hypothetical protein